MDKRTRGLIVAVAATSMIGVLVGLGACQYRASGPPPVPAPEADGQPSARASAPAEDQEVWVIAKPTARRPKREPA